MPDESFQEVEQALRERGPQAGLDFLAEKFRSEKRYPQLFEARLMKKRLELGLPLVQLGSLEDVPEPLRPAYEKAFVAAARETGLLFLADGDIARAWSYLRAIGETAPVIEAIERVPATAEGVEEIIRIAFQEQAHPQKGFELILEKFGVCRAISAYEGYQSQRGRTESLLLLARSLYKELVASLQWAIGQREGQPPEADTVPALIAGREWLFGQYDYYVDPSHVNAVLRFAADSDDPEALRLALELAEYGQHLNEQFQYRSDPPFENACVDYAVWIRALLGQDVEQAVAHFRQKMEQADPEQAGSRPAEVFVNLLVRLERYAEAIQVSRERLSEVSPAYLTCPTTRQLCQLAGDYDLLIQLSREQGDLLSFAAGLVQKESGAPVEPVRAGPGSSR